MEGLKTIFSPSNSYQVFHLVEEEVKVIVVQTTTKKTMVHPMKILNNPLKLEHNMKRKKKMMKRMLMHC